jgi:chromosome segregation ATPase
MTGGAGIGISSPLEPFLSLDSHPLESIDLHAVPLEIDEWSSQEAFEAALLKKNPISPSEVLVSVLKKNVESLQLGLTKLVNSISSVDAKRFDSACADLLKQSEAERTRLELEIARMKASLKEASKELFHAEKRRKVAEKELDRLTVEEASRQAPVAAPPTPSSVPSISSKDPTDAVATAASSSTAVSTSPASSADEGMIKQYSEKIDVLGAQLSVLTKQLEQTDGLRSTAEKALSEYITRDRKDSENATAVLRAAYEARIAALDHQLCNLVNDLANSENLAASIESNAHQTIEALTTQTQEKIAELETALDESRKNLSIAQSESDNSVALKNQVAELLTTIESMKSECASLREQRKQQIIASERLEKHLGESRTREAQNSSGGSGEGGRSAREQELEVELEDVRAQVNDLILEIETVMETEEKVKAQIISLHQQLADNQKLQRALIEENVSLKHDVSSRVNRADDATKK